jgi:hypothetical protein
MHYVHSEVILRVTHSSVGEGAKARSGYNGNNMEGDIHDP